MYIQFPLLYAGKDYTFTFFDTYRLVGYLLQIIAVTGVFIGFKLYRENRIEKKKVARLGQEKQEIELQFLRSQLHPHFLFNTLNSLYYEIVNKSDKAGDLVIQLSEILRYTLYECRDDQIKLSKELTLIKSYISLEESRYGKRLQVNFTFSGNEDLMLPPLVCFSLVENAFKHGAASQVSSSEINISVESNENNFVIDIDNPVGETITNDEFGSKKGIGIQNITRQLDILYPEKYQLSGFVEGSRYKTKLILNLD